MGMYDDIAIADGILPAELNDVYWQTKSFYCNLDWFALRSDLQLYCTRGKFLGKLDYTGIVEIHGYDNGYNPYHQITEKDKFYSYLLDFQNGILQNWEENIE